MRTAKLLSLIVGGVVALVAIALVAVWLLVNPNDYRDRISAAVKHATGRDLELKGDLKLSLFPWIALQLGPASLGNPPGFTGRPLVAFQHAAVRVKLIPLLSKRLEIGRIEVDGLDLRLFKNAEGVGNWQGFGKSDAAAPAAAPGNPPAAEGGDALQGIAGVKLTHARVSYQTITVENIELETGSFAQKGEVPVTLHVDADRGVAGERAALDAHFDFSIDSDAERYGIAALNMDAALTRAGQPRAERVGITAPSVEVDLKKQTLSVPAFAVSADGAEVSGSIAGNQIVDAMSVTGSVKLAPLVVREWLARMGMAVPPTRDPKALSLVSASANFAYGGNAAQLEQLAATLDETHLSGSAGVNLETHALAFNLAVDTLDLDRYLPPATQGPAAPVTAPVPATAAPEPAAPLEANGSLTVGTLHMSPLDLSAVKVTVATHDKVMRIYPLLAQVDGGQYSGDMSLDNRTSLPAISMDEHLSGVDVAKLLASESKKMKVSGRGNVNLKATGHGVGADAILKTLNGHFDTNIADGALEGVDIEFELARAQALFRRQAMPTASNGNRTKFSAFKMSAEITNGVAATHDLLISSAVLKITGQGTANIPTQALNFSLVADTLQTAGGTPIQVPVAVTGSFSDPTIRPDVAALAKGALKQKVQDVLQDKLKGLFGKP